MLPDKIDHDSGDRGTHEHDLKGANQSFNTN
jgi:hypothetical protein